MRHTKRTETQCVSKVIFLIALIMLLVGQSDPLGAQDNTQLQVNATNPAAGEESLYTLQFTATDTLDINATFEIDYPVEFELSKTTIADSDAINGGFSVAVSGQTVTIVRKGKGDPVAPGSILDLKYALIGNAPDQGSYTIVLRIRPTSNDATLQTLTGTIVTTQGQ